MHVPKKRAVAGRCAHIRTTRSQSGPCESFSKREMRLYVLGNPKCSSPLRRNKSPAAWHPAATADRAPSAGVHGSACESNLKRSGPFVRTPWLSSTEQCYCQPGRHRCTYIRNRVENQITAVCLYYWKKLSTSRVRVFSVMLSLIPPDPKYKQAGARCAERALQLHSACWWRRWWRASSTMGQVRLPCSDLLELTPRSGKRDRRRGRTECAVCTAVGRTIKDAEVGRIPVELFAR